MAIYKPYPILGDNNLLSCICQQKYINCIINLFFSYTPKLKEAYHWVKEIDFKNTVLAAIVPVISMLLWSQLQNYEKFEDVTDT